MIYDFVFVVLVYRNTSDLKEFFDNLRVKNSKVIVVNSFYDKDTDERFKQIAEMNDADFLSVPNKGYGAGNNRGCEYALEKYKFKYVVISNADIKILQMRMEDLKGHEAEILAPDIRDKNGKKQNPHMAFSRSKFGYDLRYWAYKYKLPLMKYILPVISRTNKILFYILNALFGRTKIFAAHGAFVLIPCEGLKKMMPLYDERVFLFAEETHLGLNASKHGIKTRYMDCIKILHKEDGSVGMESINAFNIGIHSYMCLHNYWFEKDFKEFIN